MNFLNKVYKIFCSFWTSTLGWLRTRRVRPKSRNLRSYPEWTGDSTWRGSFCHRRIAWAVQGGRSRPQAVRPVGRPPLKRPLGPFRGGPPIGRRSVWHDGPYWYFLESMATPYHTSMAFVCGLFQVPSYPPTPKKPSGPLSFSWPQILNMVFCPTDHLPDLKLELHHTFLIQHF
jgi:hypothetical protein